MIRIGVIGCGYWGPNLVRNFHAIPEARVVACCDKEVERLQRMRALYPEVDTTTRAQDLLDAGLDAVAIATPPHTHHSLAKAFLSEGMHVLVEKPVAQSAAECIELIELAECRGTVLMVGHTFEYTAAVNLLKEIVESGEIGEVLYISSTRVNLGLFQQYVNVIWDLAPHDISIISYVLGKEPVSVNACGISHFSDGIEDVAMTTLTYEGGPMAFLHNSWIDPNKIRKMVFAGSKKMVVYDDLEVNEKIKIYDKGVEKLVCHDKQKLFEYSYRYGDVHSPVLEDFEPLGAECRHFVECITHKKTPRSDGYSGLRVVRVLEAASASLRQLGHAVNIEHPDFAEIGGLNGK